MELVGRLFLALPLPPDVVGALAASLEPLEIPGRVVVPENWHLTLRFLGWTDQVGHERILAALDEAELGPPFVIRLGALGAFPRPTRANVLWVGLEEGMDEARTLGEVVEEVARRVGYDPEERPLHPHVTLSRIRPPQSVTELVDNWQARPLRWKATELVLYRSHLGRSGARYEKLEVFPLGPSR